MNLEQLLQYIFSGITMGGIYAVVAIGYNIIYSATGIINFSQGEFVMIGGMLSYTFAEMMPLVPAIALAVAITVLIGALIEIIFIRTMKRPTVLGMIIITIGLSIIIREAALHVWDEQIRALKFFSGTEISSISIFGAHVSPQVLWVLGTTAVIVLGLYLFLPTPLLVKQCAHVLQIRQPPNSVASKPPTWLLCHLCYPRELAPLPEASYHR